MPILKTGLSTQVGRCPSRLTQAGVTLLESLVAMLVLAVGVVALSGVQLRTLIDAQTSLRRAQAVRAIEDLAERVKANPDGFGQLRSGGYASGWDADVGSTDDGCTHKACSPGELAKSDLMRWKSNLADTLPLGRASVFTSPDENADVGRQLGVMVGWRTNERPSAADAAGTTPFEVRAAGIDCPEGLTCHLVYVQP